MSKHKHIHFSNVYYPTKIPFLPLQTLSPSKHPSFFFLPIPSIPPSKLYTMIRQRQRRKKKKSLSSDRDDITGDWMFSSKVFANAEDLSRSYVLSLSPHTTLSLSRSPNTHTHTYRSTTSLMDVSEINGLISRPPTLTRSLPYKKRRSLSSQEESPASTLRLLRQIRSRLDGDNHHHHPHHHHEIYEDKEAEAKMANDLHMTVEELERFEELSLRSR